MSNLVLVYKGKSIVVLTEDEIVNNTYDGLVNTGYLMDRLSEALRDLGVLEEASHEQA